MKRKLFFAGVLIFALSNILFAGQSEVYNISQPLVSFNNSISTSIFGPMASEGLSNYQDFTGGQRAGAIGLNFLFGIGSYSMGDIGHGVILTLLEGGGIFAIALPSLMGWNLGLSGKEDNKSTTNYNEAITAESNLSVLCWAGGAALLVTDIIFNIIWPLNYHRPRAKTALLNDARNWNASFVPGKDGLGVCCASRIKWYKYS
jgi:hypothetical protein